MRRVIPILFLGIVIVFGALILYAKGQVRATKDERTVPLPGDDFIPHPLGSLHHAITIRRRPYEVWPWLAQMGSGRAGWYVYDFVDNGGHPSTERILLEYQEVSVGTVFPALPNATDVFVVAQYEKDHSLVLAWKLPGGKYQVTWAFVLEQSQPDKTRLIVRGRVASGYHPYGLPQWFAVLTARPAHFIMQRKQLLGIARRVERGYSGARDHISERFVA
jgi:hypothetical protein